MPDHTVTVIVSDGMQFGYEGRTFTGGDLISLPAEHVHTWLSRGLVELPEDHEQTPHNHMSPARGDRP
ncbi:hypothetical protein QCN29_21215 [Streptomyces sp. HNM0663]|uniref:Uncharacterized protein n=1 Tax=Streptomyces chengmaiensis TaxID=3040919 RepID=A0ABT6HRA4_9ACTN|nr:hypothetical protein [Streptomyces chengmaiensis]MDH2391256.1 hypothetical protein [Streptomyces chengmaiensis]